MAVMALCASLATIPHQVKLGVPFRMMIDRTLDLFTVTVPPALPAAMSCGIVFAINRLKKQDIFCISPPRINMAGQLATFVFDKTGTLTEEGLSVLGFRSTAKNTSDTKSGNSRSKTSFINFTENVSTLTPQSPWWKLSNATEKRNENSILFVEAMASCTAITYVDGKLVGDPLDVQMFESTNWIIDESNDKR